MTFPAAAKIKRNLFAALFAVFCLELGSAAFFAAAGPGLLDPDDEVSRRVDWVKRRLTGRRPGGGNPSSDVYDPVTGWSLKPGLRDLRTAGAYGLKTVNSNSRGIRGLREFAYGKGSKKRILFLGDSFTFGEEAGDEETYPAFLQRLLGDGVEVINMGVHGYGHDQMLLRLEREGVKYEPDLVVLGFCPVDISRNSLAFRDYAKPRFELRDGRLALTGGRVPAPEEVIAAEFFRLHSWDLARWLAGRVRRRWFYRHYEKEEAALTLALLDRIKAVAEANNSKFLLLSLPEPGFLASGRDSAGAALAGSFCASRKVLCCSPAQALRAGLPRLGAVDPRSHYSPAVNREVALYLGRFLREHRLP